MKWDYEMTRQDVDDLVDMHATQSQPGEWAGNLLCIAAVAVLVCAFLSGVFVRCWGQAC
jgi:hypothetical protein